EKIKEINNLDEHLNSLLQQIQESLQNLNNIRHPQEMFDEYIKNVKSNLESREKQLIKERDFFEKILKEKTEVIERLYQEKSQGFPWLAKAYSDYSSLCDMKIADWLSGKKRPAVKTADIVREMAAEKRESERKFKISKYLLEMYESLFPFLIEFRGEDLDDYIRIRLDEYNKEERPEDEVIIYTTHGERETLSKQEIFQRALDRYWQKEKRPWEIGRDYERYVGYLYEKDGYSVYYQGIVEGFSDLG